MSNRFRYYFLISRSLSPKVVIKKLFQKIENKGLNAVSKVAANVFGTEITDAKFLRKAWDPKYQFKDLEELKKYFCERKEVKLFIDSSKQKHIVSFICKHFPDAPDKIVGQADKICEHIFDLLGSGSVKVYYEMKAKGFEGHCYNMKVNSNKIHSSSLIAQKKALSAISYEPIDWHIDFKSGYRWNSRVYYKDIKYGHKLGVDIKVPWELSRFQHLPIVGKAYWLTGDEKYTREFIDEINDWIESNPPLYGANWTCTMDVAIRVVNWIWGYYFFKESPEITDEFLLKFFKSLWIHGKYIMGNLERSFNGVSTNHYVSDIVGLVYLGVVFPEFKEAKKWQEFGIKELVREMGKQVYPDGVDYEGSISYHRLITELFLSATLLCLKNGITFPKWYMRKLEKMIEFVTYYTKPDGTAPQIGDNDDGRLHILANYGNWNRLDHRYLLSIGAVLFERQDFKQAAGEFHEEAFWLLGGQVNNQQTSATRLQATENRQQSTAYSHTDSKFGQQLKSKAFTNGGLYIMRHNDLYMIVDCVHLDSKSPSGHKHNSRLSFELFAYDKSFIIDPGAYIYTADKEMRNLFRSTRYHNTVVVDGEEQNRFDENKLFSMGFDAVVKVNNWETTERYDLLDVEHKGYERLKESVIHRRQIYFNKLEGYWVIKDILSGRGVHQFDIYFHFAPFKIELDEEFPLVAKTKIEGTNLAIIPLETKGVSVNISKDWVSYRYGVKVEAPIVRYSKKSQAPTSFCNITYPYKGEIDISKIKQKEQWGASPKLAFSSTNLAGG